MTVNTADLWDDRGELLQSIALPFINFGAITNFSGPARTVRCFEDNVLLKSILQTPGDGAVLVVDGGGSVHTALMGDMIAEIAVSHGWSGIVIYGAVRVRVALSVLPLGIKAMASNPRKSAKSGAGEADIALEIAGVVVRPGSMVYSDEDGILIER